MNNSNLISTLKANKLMRSREEVLAFDDALNQLAKNTHGVDLEKLHLILDDNCLQQEVMWGLVHVLESFDAREQLQALLNVIQKLVISAPEWTEVIHYRIFNDEPTRVLYQEMLETVDLNSRQIVTRILEEVARKGQLINV
ncbi:unknown protein [Rivularia sp. IAM M-261]|nr:unknown protein [Calothrix sp. PCC 7716]GJD24189.1 unknown protein [Rivularia sp. IAM M-261]